VGTPLLLKCLSQNGRHDLAAKLLFNEDYPSWLYAVNLGATTIWERWNGIKPDGSFEDYNMNSFNHYAYGAVGDWMYGEVCGVKVLAGGEGYKKIRLAPKPCERLGFARCSLDTVAGRIESAWYYTADRICFEFTVPVGTVAEITLPNGVSETVTGGSYCYSVKR
jgi:alpha-L-rhamnosidase